MEVFLSLAGFTRLLALGTPGTYYIDVHMVLCNYMELGDKFYTPTEIYREVCKCWCRWVAGE